MRTSLGRALARQHPVTLVLVVLVAAVSGYGVLVVGRLLAFAWGDTAVAVAVAMAGECWLSPV